MRPFVEKEIGQVPQPAYADFDSSVLDLSAESSDLVEVRPIEETEAVEALPSALGTQYVIGPDRPFEVPQRVWLSVPAGADARDLRVYYYHSGAGDAGWYEAENVEGWVVPDSYLDVEFDGTVYIGFLVRHPGAVQLGSAREKDERVAALVSGSLPGADSDTLLLIILAVWAVARRPWVRRRARFSLGIQVDAR